MLSKLPDIAKKTDVLLGNLEDAIPADRKEAAREGLVKIGKEVEFGDTALWTRVNSLDSPWFLDDVLRLVGEIGDRLEVLMLPKVEGPWDIHFIDRLLSQLEAKHGLKRQILVHAILETGLGVDQRRRHRDRQPAHAGHELRPGGSRRVAAHEDDARRRRPPRLPRRLGSRSQQSRRAAPERAAGPLALLDRAHGRRLHGRRHPALLRPLRRHQRRGRLRSAVPRQLPDGLRRRLVAAPEPDRDREEGVLAGSGRSRVREEACSKRCPTAAAC